MKIKLPNLFPNELVDLVSKTRKPLLLVALQDCIIASITSSTNFYDFESVTLDSVEALDNQYFDLSEEGKKEESFEFFRLARLAQAAVEIKSGNIENSLYEYKTYLGEDQLDELLSCLGKRIDKT